MPWTGVTIGGRTDLYVFQNGVLTAQRYKDILRPFVVPYAGAIGDGFLLVDNKARPHRAAQVDNMLHAEGIERVARRFTGLKPDNVWDALGRRIADRPALPTTVAEQDISLREEWPNIPQELIDNIILAMPRKRGTVLAIRRDHTRN